jgi:hypothetical protein
MQDDGNLVTVVAGWTIWASKGYTRHNVRGEDRLPMPPNVPRYPTGGFLPAPSRPDRDPSATDGFERPIRYRDRSYDRWIAARVDGCY